MGACDLCQLGNQGWEEAFEEKDYKRMRYMEEMYKAPLKASTIDTPHVPLIPSQDQPPQVASKKWWLGLSWPSFIKEMEARKQARKLKGDL